MNQRLVSLAGLLLGLILTFTAIGPAPAGAAPVDVGVASAEANRNAEAAQLRQVERLVRIAERQARHAGSELVRTRHGRLLHLSGVGRPAPKLRQAIGTARRKTGLRVRWTSVRHTRVELRRAGAVSMADDRVDGAILDQRGRWLWVHANDKALGLLSHRQARIELGLTVRIRITGPGQAAPGRG